MSQPQLFSFVDLSAAALHFITLYIIFIIDIFISFISILAKDTMLNFSLQTYINISFVFNGGRMNDPIKTIYSNNQLPMLKLAKALVTSIFYI